MGWVVVEGVVGDGGDGTGRLQSELTVHCEQRGCSLTAGLRIYNESQPSFCGSEAGFPEQLDWTVDPPEHRDDEAHGWQPERPQDVGSEDVSSAGAELDMSR